VSPFVYFMPIHGCDKSSVYILVVNYDLFKTLSMLAALKQ